MNLAIDQVRQDQSGGKRIYGSSRMCEHAKLGYTKILTDSQDVIWPAEWPAAVGGWERLAAANSRSIDRDQAKT